MYAPPALSHNAADKYVRLDNNVIVGTSPSFDCTLDTKQPINSGNTMKSRGPRTKWGGHIGFVMTSFTSGTGLAPEFPWHMIETYPAINGVTRINSVWFSGFGVKCGRRSVAIMTNPLSPDAMHPTQVRMLSRMHGIKIMQEKTRNQNNEMFIIYSFSCAKIPKFLICLMSKLYKRVGV